MRNGYTGRLSCDMSLLMPMFFGYGKHKYTREILKLLMD